MSGRLTDNTVSCMYVLDSNNNPISTTRDFFLDFMANGDRSRVAEDYIQYHSVKIKISTIFTGIKEDGCLFRTMIIGGEFHSSKWLHKTYDDAINKHNEIAIAFAETTEM